MKYLEKKLARYEMVAQAIRYIDENHGFDNRYRGIRDNELLIIWLLMTRPSITRAEIVNILGVTPNTVSGNMSRLRAIGFKIYSKTNGEPYRLDLE